MEDAGLWRALFMEFSCSGARGQTLSQRSTFTSIRRCSQNLWLILILLSGCFGGNAAIPRGTVRGDVSLDSKPLSSGEIIFYPTGTSHGPATYGQIKDGKYEIVDSSSAPIIGMHRVEIRSQQPTGKKDSQGFDVVQEAIPKKFNVMSTLTADVHNGLQTIDFHLKSK